MRTLEFYYDVASPYTYLASTRVEAIAADCKAALVWKPFLLGGVFKAIGNKPPAELMPRARYMGTDLQRWAKYYGAPMNTLFPLYNSLLPMRVIAAAPPDQLAERSHLLFHAYWVDGQSIAEESVLTELVGAEAVAAASLQSTKDLLRANTEEAVARGAFGSPTFFVGDDMYFGNDRLPFVEQALRG